MIIRNYKYRIYPTESQKDMINKTIGVCRFIYNLALETKIRAWQSCGVNLSAYDLSYQVTELKKDHPWISEVDSQAVLCAVHRVEKSFKNFFRGSGYPKFKSKRNGGSFQSTSGTKNIDWDKGFISIAKIKNIPIVLSRRFEGKMKTITVTKTPTDKYYIAIYVETDDPSKKLNNYGESVVGVDLGIKHFAVLSTGEKIDNPRYLQSKIKRLKVLQKRVSRKKKGSENRKKANKKVAALHEKITNQRSDFLHKVSSKIIGDSQANKICIETLTVKNMIKNKRISQAISDAAWGEFVRYLEYKGKWYGKNVIKINKFFASSKICSSCGHKYEEMELSDREWECSNCGVIHDRDINAAINIRNSGMGSPVEPVELPAIAGAKKQEGAAN